MRELRRCPWCQSEPKLDQDGDSSWYVACKVSACPVMPITKPYRHAHQARIAWNSTGPADICPTPKG